jgi:hypothetical protein
MTSDCGGRITNRCSGGIDMVGGMQRLLTAAELNRYAKPIRPLRFSFFAKMVRSQMVDFVDKSAKVISDRKVK